VKSHAGFFVPVAQVGNLLYRRLVVGRLTAFRAAADYQSATQQTASLRYELKYACNYDSDIFAGEKPIAV
jgi:hypothetical protein